MVELLMQCPFCGTPHAVTVNAEDYIKYEEGALVQVAFPYLNATERESIISSMCPDCQAKIFGEEE